MNQPNYNLEVWDKKFDALIEMQSKIMKDINYYLLEYFQSSFTTKSFNNKQWKRSKNNPNTLIDSGTLKKSIKTVQLTDDLIHIESDTPYSAIHNYGGTIRITDKMRKFFWAQFYKTKNDSWKWMAISKASNITIPERQFIGIPNTLKQDIEKILNKYIK